MTATLEAPRSPEAEVRWRLGRDTPFWAESLGVKIANDVGQRSPLKPRWAQLELDRVMVEQQASGFPVRVVVLKSRKTGVSTWTQLKALQRATQLENHGVYTVCHDAKTAAELWQMAWVGYTSLPDDPDVRPGLVSKETGERLHFGETARSAQLRGELGVNSKMEWTTAKEAEAGRGFTIRTLHGSEVAFWPDIDTKLTALLQAIPEQDPDTIVVLESTARGHNAFKELWDDAEEGRNDFVPVFIPWWRDPVCTRRFANDEERDAFSKTIGVGEWADEERLVEQFECVPEQLAWRRSAIRNKLRGNVQKFKQEYPASPEEAFIASGATVFAGVVIENVVDHARAAAAPGLGRLEATSMAVRRGRVGQLEVPGDPVWRPVDDPNETGVWTVWKHPVKAGDLIPLEELDPLERLAVESGVRPQPTHDRPGAYVIAEDPSDPDEESIESGDGGLDQAASALVVIDHRTREQVAELETFDDPDLVAVQAYLAALYYNDAILAIETTGGYGGAAARRIYFDYGYPFVYFRRAMADRKEKLEQRLGWDTNRVSKAILIDDFREVLRDHPELLRSVRLAKQLTWFIRLGRSRTGPQRGKRADLLMAMMIAQYVANDEPIPTPRKPGSNVSVTGRRVRSRIGGY